MIDKAKVMEVLEELREDLEAGPCFLGEEFKEVYEKINALPDGIHLRKFLPGSDLSNGRYLMNNRQCVTVKDGYATYDEPGASGYLESRWERVFMFWIRWKRPIWGVLPLEGEEGA